MMMMVFWPHIYNCLAYMASLAKKYFWSNVLNRSLLIAEGGTYAKIRYVEKIILCDVFQKWSKKFKFSRNQKHHEKRLKKSRIRETKHLSTFADSSTDTTVGWTKNTQKRKKSSKMQKLKKSRDMPKLAIYPSTRGLSSIGNGGFQHVL